MDSQESPVDSESIDLNLESEEVSKGKQASSSNASSNQPRSHGKESHAAVNGDASYKKLAEKFGEVALAIKRLSKDQLIVSDLYEEVMNMEGFDRIMLAF